MDTTRVGVDCAFEFRVTSRRDTALDRTLELAVEAPAGIQLQRIRRQEKHLVPIRVCGQPVLYQPGLVYFRVSSVRKTLRLALSVCRQTSYKQDQVLRCDAASVDHEPNLALAGHRHDH